MSVEIYFSIITLLCLFWDGFSNRWKLLIKVYKIQSKLLKCGINAPDIKDMKEDQEAEWANVQVGE